MGTLPLTAHMLTADGHQQAHSQQAPQLLPREKQLRITNRQRSWLNQGTAISSLSSLE